MDHNDYMKNERFLNILIHDGHFTFIDIVYRNIDIFDFLITENFQLRKFQKIKYRLAENISVFL